MLGSFNFSEKLCESVKAPWEEQVHVAILVRLWKSGSSVSEASAASTARLGQCRLHFTTALRDVLKGGGLPRLFSKRQGFELPRRRCADKVLQSLSKDPRAELPEKDPVTGESVLALFVRGVL